ncbi:hypothetical protein ACFX15_024601 [Malus domestica]
MTKKISGSRLMKIGFGLSGSSFNGDGVRVLHQWILHSHSGHRAASAVRGANVRAHLGLHIHEPCRYRSPRQV